MDNTEFDSFGNGKDEDSKKKSKTKGKLKTQLVNKNAERERSRVKSLRHAFQSLQECLPSVPPNTKLSKLDILILATNYISYLTKMLHNDEDDSAELAFDAPLKYLHPIKKWPMRSRLYALPEAGCNFACQSPTPDETLAVTSLMQIQHIYNFNNLF